MEIRREASMLVLTVFLTICATYLGFLFRFLYALECDVRSSKGHGLRHPLSHRSGWRGAVTQPELFPCGASSIAAAADSRRNAA
jgi:hypothetical protein